MKTSDFDFELDESLIAQTPILDRSSSRMLVLDKNSGEIKHECFRNIVDYLDESCCLVLNDTRVIPARLYGVKEKTNANIELLLLKQEGDIWESLVKPAKRIHLDDVIIFGEGLLKAQCVGIMDNGIRKFKMIYDGIFMEILDKLGEMPLPPYIHEHLDDKDRYQTVYAKNVGSAAAPTAGLHFTNEILEALKKKGVTIVYVTLHVGLGTFRPVMEEEVLNHKMHSEYYCISKEAADALNEAMRLNKRIVSVGTTSTRTLESAYDNGFKECYGNTEIFIYPGYKFKVVDSLITNFHLPKSTLVMLVSALATKENIMKAYNEAIKERYRFFSFGDCMFIK